MSDAAFASIPRNDSSGWLGHGAIAALGLVLYILCRDYPAELPPLPDYLKSKAEMIQTAARLLAMADYYDALMNRNNDKNGQKALTPKQRREIYMKDNADMKWLAELLESVGVLKF